MGRNIFNTFLLFELKGVFLHSRVQRFVKPHAVPVLCLQGEAETVVVAFSKQICWANSAANFFPMLGFFQPGKVKKMEGRNRKAHGFISALLCLSLSWLQVDTGPHSCSAGREPQRLF